MHGMNNQSDGPFSDIGSGPIDAGKAADLLATQGVKGVPEAVAADIVRFIAAGNRIEAIKLLRRSVPGYGLKDAKDIVDNLSNNMGVKIKSGCGAGMLLVGVGCSLAAAGLRHYWG